MSTPQNYDLKMLNEKVTRLEQSLQISKNNTKLAFQKKQESEEEFEKETKELNKKIVTLDNQLRESKKHVGWHMEEIHHLKWQLKLRDSRIATLERDLRMKQNEISMTNKRIQKKDDLLDILSGEKEKLRQESERLVSDVVNLQKEISNRDSRQRFLKANNSQSKKKSAKRRLLHFQPHGHKQKYAIVFHRFHKIRGKTK